MSITYCIVCNITGEKYYGSTKQTLEKRMNVHKCKSNKCCSKQIIERGDYDIYQLGEYETIEEAEMKEDWYIDNKECINKHRVKLTDDERTQYNIKNGKRYREKNREKIIEKYQKNKDKISETMKEYYKINRDYIIEKKKEYYQENKDEINKNVECEFCKCILMRKNMKKHQKSKKCLKYQ